MSAPTSATDPFGQDSSGSTAFRMTTDDVITEAFSIMQIGIEGESLTPERFANGKRSLNLLLGTWQAQGIHLWTYEEGTLFLEAGKNSYTLEQVQATNYYTLTTTTVASLATDTVVTLATTELKIDQEGTDNLDTDWYIGFLKADNNLFWTTVVSASGDDITITDGIPEDMAIGTQVIFYRDKVRAVERLHSTRRIDGFYTGTTLTNEVPVALESHQEFFDLPTKGATGVTSLSYYQRKLPEGILWVWQTPQDSLKPINFTYERKLEDFVLNDDCADVPKYWLEALCYGLADRLKIKYRVPPQLSAEIATMADRALSQALEFDDANYDLSVSINREV
jgi:hypothetical protein